jgi:hypothetical protein
MSTSIIGYVGSKSRSNRMEKTHIVNTRYAVLPVEMYNGRDKLILLSPRATKLPEGYRFLPVCMYIRMILSCYRSSDFISRTILKIHTSVQYGKTSNEFAFHDAASKVKVTDTIFV